MARIVFVVNQHPTEAFSASVAVETAKHLRKAGHEIVWEKIKPGETMLGAVLRPRGKKKFSERKLTDIEQNINQRILTMLEKNKADLLYDFHATPPENVLWKKKHTGAEHDYSFDGEYHGEQGRTVEVKAYYQSLPKRILRKIEQRMPEVVGTFRMDYFSKVTSPKLTRQAGLTKEEFGKAIAERIQRQIARLAHGESLNTFEYGKIPRRFPKPKPRAHARRR